MATRQAENDSGDANERRHQVKRRGLIAGAAALVAGMVATKTSQPVRASALQEQQFEATGNSDANIPGFINNSLSYNYGVDVTGAVVAVHGTSGGGIGVKGSVPNSGYGVYGESGIGYGVYGTATTGIAVGGDSSNTGVLGRGGGDTTANATGFPMGVRGSVPNTGYGVYGQAGSGNGVYGNAPGGVGVSGNGGTGVQGVGSGTGVQGLAGGDTSSNTTTFPIGVRGSVPNSGYGVYGNAGIGAGVHGNAIGGAGVDGAATTGVGAQGIATSGTGVFGQSSGNSGSIAVRGKHTASGYAVYGEATANGGFGVTGVSGNAYGVLGQSTGGVGAQGEITGGSVASTVGVRGINSSTGAGGIGVQGQCDVASGIGVIGTSTAGIGVKGISASGFPIIGAATGSTNANAGVLGIGMAGPGVQGQSHGHGLVGTTSATDGQHAALIGSVQPGGNAIALRGSIPASAGGFAGVFDGPVIVNGSFQVFGAPKSAAVKHPGDGTYRLLYCEESPESWFADYGEGTLSADKAEIKLDADFAALVHTDAYHVFVTAHGPQHLHVAARTATGFSVVATAIGGAAGGPKPAEGGGTFSWRVVAKRKDIAGERLAKVPPPPPLTPVTPFTEPETPAAKPPTTKP